MKISLKNKNKKIVLDVDNLNLFGKVIGLMFTRRENAKALLFDFKHDCNFSIHSLFVFFPFLAIWINGKGEIVEKRIISSWKLSVNPKDKFSKLIEIPINRRYSNTLKQFS